MFDFGWAELLVIMAIAVFVIGPKEIPDIMMTLGRAVRRMQYIKYAFTQQFEDFMQHHDLNEIRHYAAMSDEIDGYNENVPLDRHGEPQMLPLDKEQAQAQAQAQASDEKVQANDKSKRLDVAALYAHIEKDYVAAFQQPSDNIDDFLEYFKGRSVSILDVGCGPGVDVFYLYNRGHQVTGLDLSTNMVEQARKKCPDAVLKHGDMRDMPFDDGAFDGVVSSYSIIHLTKEDMPQVFKEFSRVLTLGGVLYIGFQAGAPLETWVNEPFDPSVAFFLNICNIHEISTLLQEHGFEVLNVYERDFTSEEELPFEKVSMLARKIS